MTIHTATRTTRSTRVVGWVQVVLVALVMDLSLGAGWVINLAVAEYVIRRPARRRTISRPTIAATAPVGS